MELPKLSVSMTLIALEERTKLRTDIADPALMKSRIDKLLLSLANVLIDKLLPVWMKSSTDKLEDKRHIERTESVEPIDIKSMTDAVFFVANFPKMETALPNLPAARILIVDAHEM